MCTVRIRRSVAQNKGLRLCIHIVHEGEKPTWARRSDRVLGPRLTTLPMIFGKPVFWNACACIIHVRSTLV